MKYALALAALLAGASLAASEAATGSGLYTTQQAATGAKVYAQNCARCHGVNLEGVSGPPLKGKELTAPGAQGKLTVSDIFKYMTSLMPAGNPGSLSHDQYAAIMAFILKQNGGVPGSKPLAYDTALHSNAPIGGK